MADNKPTPNDYVLILGVTVPFEGQLWQHPVAEIWNSNGQTFESFADAHGCAMQALGVKFKDMLNHPFVWTLEDDSVMGEARITGVDVQPALRGSEGDPDWDWWQPIKVTCKPAFKEALKFVPKPRKSNVVPLEDLMREGVE